MTLTILVSFSLLALVVTARPILPNDAPQSIRSSIEVQNAVQAIFESHTGHPPDCLTCDGEQDVRISLTSSEEQDAYLARLEDLDAIKAVLPLGADGAPTEDEKQLYEILTNLKDTGSLNDLDGGERPLPQDELSAHPEEDAALDTEPVDSVPAEMPLPDAFASPPLVVLAVSCVAALLTLVFVSAGLYTVHYLRTSVLTSDLAWEMLPRLEKRAGLDDDHNDLDDDGYPEEKKVLLIPGAEADLPQVADVALAAGDEPRDPSEKPAASDAHEPAPEDEDSDEKFHDAPEPSLLFVGADAPSPPRIVIETHPDPALLPLPTSAPSTPLPSPVRRPLQMREAAPASPVSRPAWSLRAADAPRSASPLRPRRTTSPALYSPTTRL
ncbi:hypothetical protein A0H81_13667 [Grifola frondosa]|uniref:Uncharacterized protein n=1 Tax=Grifola frondosa TaxID=5627 RepID=A0A1C7LNV7_GRIFR|nr:hypothetical protein A0H81_13667 [Grifola frondosa]